MVVFVLLLLGSSLLLPSLVFVLFFGLGKKDVLSGSRAIQVYRLLGSTFDVKKLWKSIHDNICVFVFLECVLRLFWGVSGVLGTLFGLHRHKRIAYMLISRKPLKVSDMVRHMLQKPFIWEPLGSHFSYF